MIVDCFPFLNENDLVEIRLNELSPVVDKFVITEGTKTFSGKDKPLFFDKDRFSKFPIEYVVYDNPVKDSWDMEHEQKEIGLKRALELNPDYLILGDCDEIPTREAIVWGMGLDFQVACLQMDLYYYYLNCRCISKKWRSCKLVRPYKGMTHLEVRKGKKDNRKITEAGWHFSYLGDIQYKVNASAHVEYGKPPYNTPEHIESHVKGFKDLFDRKQQFIIDEGLGYLPQYVLNNMEKFGKYIHAYDINSHSSS